MLKFGLAMFYSGFFQNLHPVVDVLASQEKIDTILI